MRNKKWIVVLCLVFLSLIAGNYAEVQAVSNTETKVVTQNINQNKYVKAEGGLIVRKEAHSKGAKVTMLKDGSKVFVYSTDSNGWSYIKQGNVKGYVKDSYLVDIEQDSHYSKKNKNRIIDFSMSMPQIQKAETAKLLRNPQEGNASALIYSETKYGYSTELKYYFENKKLSVIVFDFFPNRDRYSVWSEIELIHDLLYQEAIKEFGNDVETRSDGIYNISSVWNKGSYSVMLNVNRKDLYTSATLIYFKP
ncbi:SH3 domain-containing protein [Bacillus ndiopicus]|uniref:SH3 domain-containing protein n=1 Tax=Bacillus ndiopicus TaxID=1347368 RepID=UPI0005AA727A|nr:SH3 domain-containing protein [Bacillus ndiopicus]